MSDTFLFSSESVNEGHPGEIRLINEQSRFVLTLAFVMQTSSAIRFLMQFSMRASARIPPPALLAVSFSN